MFFSPHRSQNGRFPNAERDEDEYTDSLYDEELEDQNNLKKNESNTANSEEEKTSK